MKIALGIDANDPTRAGRLASKRLYFGHDSRYAVAAVHTRFDAVQFFVWDSERPDENGFSRVIRQTDTLGSALLGLGLEETQ